MKLGTILHNGQPAIVARLDDKHAVRLAPLLQASGPMAPATMNDVIAGGETLRGQIASVLAQISVTDENVVETENAVWLPPQPAPSKIIGVAFNNVGIRKSAHVDPGVPNFFLKAPSSLIGHNEAIVIREEYGETIPELELAGVVGQRLKNATPEEALAAMFGYSIINDITSHGLKFGKDSIATTREADLIRPHHLNWRHRHGPDDNDVYFVYHARSKATDTFGPMGPWITTADEVPAPDNLDMTGFLDGEVFARDNTASYTYKVGEVVAEASRYFTLEPGDIFCFGTSAKGVGRFTNGHRDVNLHQITGVLGVEIKGLGRLDNPVRHE